MRAPLGAACARLGRRAASISPVPAPPPTFLSMCSIAAEAAHWGRCPLCPPWQIDSSWSPRALRDARPLTRDPERALCERTHNCSCVRVVGGGVVSHCILPLLITVSELATGLFCPHCFSLISESRKDKSYVCKASGGKRADRTCFWGSFPGRGRCACQRVLMGDR